MTNVGKAPRADAAGTVALGDLRVNRLAFGAMRVCGRDIWGPPADRAAAHQVIRRITETAHNPPRGVDNTVGYGMIDPVAALTFDVPLADRLPPERLTTFLKVPPPAPAPDLRPRNTALIGAAVVAAIAAVVAGAATLRRRKS